MIAPRASLASLAAAHVRAELGRQPDLERVIVRLHDCLVRLVGAGGFEVLLIRALVLARAEHPLLNGVTTGEGGVLLGLGQSELAAGAAERAATAVVANLLELLVVLVGEELTLQLLHDVLTEASAGAGAPPKEGNA